MTEAQRAHIRILEQAQLTVRTHERKFGEYASRDSVNNFKVIVIDGVRYESVTEAARELKCCRQTIRKMVKEGRAEHV